MAHRFLLCPYPAPLTRTLCLSNLESIPMKKLLGLLLGVLLCNGAVAGENDFRCFKSIGLKNPIRLQFTFPPAKQDLGYVTYQNGSAPIRVKRVKEKTIEEVPGGRPWVFQTEWEEIVGNGIGGKYVIISQ